MRHLFLLTAFCAIALNTPLGIAADANDTAPPSQEEYLLKNYDISSYYDYNNVNEYEFCETVDNSKLSFIPINPRLQRGDMEIGGDIEYPFSADHLVEMIMDIVGTESFDHEEGFFELYNDYITVRTTESNHKTIEKILGFLEKNLTNQVTLNFDIYRLNSPASLPFSDTAAVNREIANGNIVKLLSRSVEAGLGERFEIKDGIKADIVWDLESEIAQQATIIEPMVCPLFLGLNLVARPFLSNDGKRIILSLYASSSRLVEKITLRDLNSTSYISLQDDLKKQNPGSIINDPKVEFASMASFIEVALDKPTVFQTAFPHHQGMGSIIIEVSASYAHPPKSLDMGGGKSITLIDFSHNPPDYVLPIVYSTDGGLLTQDVWWENDSMNSPTLTTLVRTPMIYPEMPLERIQNLYEEITGLEQFQTYNIGNQALLFSTPDKIAKFAAIKKELFKGQSGSIFAEVKFLEVPGLPILDDAHSIIRKGQLKGIITTPLRVGDAATSMAGFEGLSVYSYDVDVATGSCISNPNITPLFDGVMVQFKHKKSFIKGNDRLQTMVLINILQPNSQRRFNSGGALGDLDQQVFNRAVIEKRIKIDNKPYLLGALTLGQGESAKTLYAIGTARHF